jgi:hypothetical protein
MVADNARIGGSPLLVFLAEVINHTGLKFTLEVNLMVGNV